MGSLHENVNQVTEFPGEGIRSKVLRGYAYVLRLGRRWEP